MATFRYPQTQTTITGGATEAKQDDIIAELQDIDANTADAATETTLSALNAKVTAVDTTGKATEAKQDSIITELQEIEADVEAGNALLTTIDADTSSIDSKIVAVDTTGKATEAKQDSIITELQEIEADVEAGNALLTTIDADTSSIDSKIVAVDTTGKATEAKQDSAITELQSLNTSVDNIEADIDELNSKLAASLVPEQFDYIALTYVAAGNGAGEIETVTYRTGGAAGTIQATLTLAYDAQDRLASVTKA